MNKLISFLSGRPFGEFPHNTILLGGGVLVLTVGQQDVDSTTVVYSLSGPHLQRPRFREGVLFDSNRRESYNVWSGRFSD